MEHYCNAECWTPDISKSPTAYRLDTNLPVAFCLNTRFSLIPFQEIRSLPFPYVDRVAEILSTPSFSQDNSFTILLAYCIKQGSIVSALARNPFSKSVPQCLVSLSLLSGFFFRISSMRCLALAVFWRIL